MTNISFFSQTSGSGKTTLAIALARYLYEKGQRVTFLDTNSLLYEAKMSGEYEQCEPTSHQVNQVLLQSAAEYPWVVLDVSKVQNPYDFEQCKTAACQLSGVVVILFSQAEWLSSMGDIYEKEQAENAPGGGCKIVFVGIEFSNNRGVHDEEVQRLRNTLLKNRGIMTSYCALIFDHSRQLSLGQVMGALDEHEISLTEQQVAGVLETIVSAAR